MNTIRNRIIPIVDPLTKFVRESFCGDARPTCDLPLRAHAFSRRDVSAHAVYSFLSLPFGWLDRVAFFFPRIPAIPPNGCKCQIVGCIRVVTAVLAFREGLFSLRIYNCLLRSRDSCTFIFMHRYSFGLLYDTTNSTVHQFAGLLVDGGHWGEISLLVMILRSRRDITTRSLFVVISWQCSSA